MYGYSATGTYDCDGTSGGRGELGFRISSCTGSSHSGAPRYGYFVQAGTSGGAPFFTAFATTGGDRGSDALNLVMTACSTNDAATINHEKTFTRVLDSVKLCSGGGY